MSSKKSTTLKCLFKPETRKKPRMKHKLVPALTAAVVAMLLAGCESSEDSSGAYWKTETPKAATSATSTTSSTTTHANSSTSSGTSGSGQEELGAEDEVPFDSLSWNYGGFRGGSAVKTTAAISGLKATAKNMSYHWKTGGCETLGASSHSDYNHTIACFFVQRGDGRWVGGKFDFISTSRTSRGFENIYDGYGGWSLSGVPNPCPCAFVIVSTDGKRRTNVIAGTWHR